MTTARKRPARKANIREPAGPFRYRPAAGSGTTAARAVNDDGARLMIRVALGPEGSLGPGKLRLLELIDEKGSISAACREMGMPHRRAWRLLQELNGGFREEVVATRHGGNQGGGAELTPFGRALLTRCALIGEKARQAVRGELDALERDYVQRASPPPDAAGRHSPAGTGDKRNRG